MDIVSCQMDEIINFSRIDFHFECLEHGETIFREIADASINMKGESLMLTELSDLDYDGDLDFCAVPNNSEMGTMVSAILRRSVCVELSCYRLTDGTYQHKPSEQRRKRLRLSVPILDSLGDVAGDDLVDGVVPTGKNRVEVLSGTEDASLFESQSIRVNVDFPKGDGSNCSVN